MTMATAQGGTATAGAAGAARSADLVIAGGGSVGLCTALAVRRADPRARVALVDARPAPDRRNSPSDERALAIAAAARRMLTRLGVWHRVESLVQPVTQMIVTDSKLRDSVRPVFLTFAGDVEPGEPFVYMVPAGALTDAIEEAALEAGVEILSGETVADFAADSAGVTVRLGSGGSVRAPLLVAADGVRSRLRGLAGIGVVRSDYRQTAIVATVAHERPHEGCAVEHFLPNGPFAILPLTGNRSSLVWTERTEEAARLMAMEDFTFETEMERRFGHHLGALSLAGPRRAHPLGITLARRFVAGRFALIGDAAHGMHPIAGQGLNMGFRDVAALAEVIVDARRLGLDPGSADALARYERWRRFDTVEMGLVTDVLNRLFRTDLDPVRFVRDIGLGLVDRLPGLKARFVREAAGLGGTLPRLMRGEAL